MNKENLDNLEVFIDNAIFEDIGGHDITSLATIPQNTKGKAALLVKEDCVIAGIAVAKRIFRRIDRNLQLELLIKDGSLVKKGDVVFRVSGSVHSILQAERLVLNVMQRMSGIATRTKKYVEKLEGLHTKVLDTRKTTPGLRFIEKLAVKTGGGENHRMGLYDMVLIKDNHVDFAGGIKQAIDACIIYLTERKLNVKIEIEVRNIDELNQVLESGRVNRIMLDNFDIEQTRKAVEIIAGRYETESSGGITLDTLRSYAECGVDYISVGELTHNIKSVDLSLKAID